jgi:hypothetical protein
MKDRYLPNTDKTKLPWLKNLETKAPVYTTVLDITPAELTSLSDDRKMFEYIIYNMLDAYETKKQDITQFKNIMRDGPLGTPSPAVPAAPTLPVAPTAVAAGIFPRIALFVKRLKSHPNYTKNIGEDLGIEGAEQTIDPLSLKPVLKAVLDVGRPLIKWKKGVTDSIDIYVDRNLSDDYVYLANDMEPDYLDTFPLPSGVTSAIWRYKAIYRIGDDQVGQYSDPVSITVSKQL